MDLRAGSRPKWSPVASEYDVCCVLDSRLSIFVRTIMRITIILNGEQLECFR